MNYVKAVVLTLAFALLMAGGAAPARAGVSFDFFYSNLSPHGSWLVSAQYGQVWQPRVYEAGWNPYYDGHWVYTDVGWTWVSDYEWGSVPYHYGTWVDDPALGWVWVPGTVWAPAWVVFRTGPDYIGWAPVAPSYTVGVTAGLGGPVAGNFVFVSTGDFLAPRVRTRIVPEYRTTEIINTTRVENNLVVENNIVVNRGPSPQVIERASGHRVREVSIEEAPRVAPTPGVTRAQLRIEPRRASEGLRAAEPVSSGTPLPARDRSSRTLEGQRPEGGTPGGTGQNVSRDPRERPAPGGPAPREKAPGPRNGNPAGADPSRLKESPQAGQGKQSHPRETASPQSSQAPGAPARGAAPQNGAKGKQPPAREKHPPHKKDKDPKDSGKGNGTP